MESNLKAIMEAKRLSGLGQEASIRDPELDNFINSVSVSRVDEETVTMEFIPSVLFGSSAKNIVTQVERIFRGAEFQSQPVLTGDTDGDVELLTRYMETHLCIMMSNIHDEIRRNSTIIKELKNENRRQRPIVPIMASHAIALWGEVTWNNSLLRIVPAFDKSYDYTKRLVTVDEYRQVRSWLKTLLGWGIQCVEDFNYSSVGDLEFMLLVYSEVTTLDDLDAEKQRRMRLKSDKPVSNIKALLRSFFINKRVEYVTDRRLITRYSDMEFQEKILEHIETNMTYDAGAARYINCNAPADKVAPEPVQDQSSTVTID